MTTVERFNLQTGKEEGFYNKYNIESPLDNYIIQTQRAKASIEDQQNALEEYVMQIIEKQLDACLEKALSDVLEKLF